MRISVIIPTRNEVESIGRVLADLPPEVVTEVIVVDSNSTGDVVAPIVRQLVGSRADHAPLRSKAHGPRSVSVPGVPKFFVRSHWGKPLMDFMTRMNRTLVIMAKAPRPGSVKTRLANSLPVQAVTELYRCLLNDTIALAKTLDHVEIALMCPTSDGEELSQTVAATVRVVPQTGSGLAAALDSAFTQFAATDSQAVIAFNSDSPHLPASALQSAFDVLESCDLVVGPTHDGGYYLVGARASYPGLFSNDAMGTASALDTLLRRASDLHLSVRVTDSFYDIDVAADLNQLTEELQRMPGKAPRTAEWLSEWARKAPLREQGG